MFGLGTGAMEPCMMALSRWYVSHAALPKTRWVSGVEGTLPYCILLFPVHYTSITMVQCDS